jgi:siderophore synthetase component
VIELLNCCVREISGPEGQTMTGDGHLTVRLVRAGALLRARLVRIGVGPAPRLALPVQERRDGGWIPVSHRRLAQLVATEMELLTRVANPEFVDQVLAGREAGRAMLAARETVAPCGKGALDTFIESERALLAGHRFHPTPKARQGDPAGWLPYAPEARARFPLHWYAVRADAACGEGDASLLDEMRPDVPSGHVALPVHPWQSRAHRSRLRPFLEAGLLSDLGPGGPEVIPTSSVRTVWTGEAFLKLSLDMRITNCVRKNAWYELAGAVALTEALRPVAADLPNGAVLLGEPAYRSVAVADRALHEGLGVIIREGVGGLAGTPVLAGALADPLAGFAARLPDGLDVLAWWRAYVRAVVPPALHAFFAHGVVFEPHLQNVLIVLDEAGMPRHAVFRDLEGTKLLPEPWETFLSGLPPRVAAAMTYDRRRAWNRLAYCLFVNHLAELLAAFADRHPDLEEPMWAAVAAEVAGVAEWVGGSKPAGWEPAGRASELRALLAGVPLPAKANLHARWYRDADREAGYVPVPNPLARALVGSGRWAIPACRAGSFRPAS